MTRFIHLVFALVSIAMVTGPAPASDESNAGRVTDEVDVVRDAELDAPRPFVSDEFSLRRRSTLELWRDRDRYRDSILAEARSDDPESVERARWILGRWQRGILSDTPRHLAEELATLSPVQSIAFLLEAGQFSAATIAMRESYGTLDFDAIHTRVAITLDQRFPIYARAAVRAETTDQFLTFLDVASSTPAMAVSRRDWAKLFATTENPGVDVRLPEAAETWDTALAQRTQVLLELLAGDVNAAMKSARTADLAIDGDSDDRHSVVAASLNVQQQPSFVRLVQILTSQWTPMAVSAAESAGASERAAASIVREAQDESDSKPGLFAKRATSSKIARHYEAAIRHWADALIASDRSGERDIRANAVAGLLANLQALSDREQATSGTAEVRALVWQTLLIHGEIDAGLDIVGKDDPAAAAMIAANASRHADAFKRLGFPADQIDTKLEIWIDDAIAAQRQLFDMANDPLSPIATSEIQTGIAPEIEKLLNLIRLLDDVNLDDAAWRIADRLSLPDLQVQPPQISPTNRVRDYVMQSLLWTTHSDWLIRLGMRDWEVEPTIISRHIISQITVNDNYHFLAVLQEFVQLRRPQLTSVEAFRIACEIARADDVDRREHSALISELAESLRDGTLRSRIPNDQGMQNLFLPATDVWSNLFDAHGRPDLTEPILQRRSSRGDLKAALTLAKEYRLNGPTSVSHDLDDEIWDAVAMSTSDGNPLYRDDVITAVDAVGEQCRAARDAGDQRTADQLLLQLRAMACTPSTDMRQQIADVLADIGQYQVADKLYRSLLVMTALSKEETQSMFEIARKYQGFVLKATAAELETTESVSNKSSVENLSPAELELRRQAIKWVDIAFLRTFHQISLRPQLYLVFPRLFAREQLEIAVLQAAADPGAPTAQAIPQLLDRLQQFDAIDIATAESILPKLTQLGMGDRANTELQRMIQAADTHLQNFPGDAVTANNVAWGAAVNNTQLDNALRLSRHAVRFEPESAIYRDTLAEILARRGDFEEAVQIERGCVIDDPGQWHLHEQVKRFEKKLSKSR